MVTNVYSNYWRLRGDITFQPRVMVPFVSVLHEPSSLIKNSRVLEPYHREKRNLPGAITFRARDEIQTRLPNVPRLLIFTARLCGGLRNNQTQHCPGSFTPYTRTLCREHLRVVAPVYSATKYQSQFYDVQGKTRTN